MGRGRVEALLILALIWLIGLYRRFVSPGLRPRCRFTPTCSAYAMESLQKHGLLKGLARALWRICRCHPLGRPGYDPP